MTAREAKIMFASVFITAVYVHLYDRELWKELKRRKRLNEIAKLRLDLIHWASENYPKMDLDDFFKEYLERSTFIRLVIGE